MPKVGTCPVFRVQDDPLPRIRQNNRIRSSTGDFDPPLSLHPVSASPPRKGAYPELVPLLANHPGLGQETPAKLANSEVHDSLILSRKLITRSSFLETSDVASWHVIGSFPLVLSRK